MQATFYLENSFKKISLKCKKFAYYQSSSLVAVVIIIVVYTSRLETKNRLCNKY